MALGLTDVQQVAADLSEQIFADLATTQRLVEVEASEVAVDLSLWTQLAASGLLGLCLAEDIGGSGAGVPELAMVLEKQGRHVAPVPLAATVISAMAVDRFADADTRRAVLPNVVAGTVMMAAAVTSAGVSGFPSIRAVPASGTTWSLSGRELCVAGGPIAGWLLVPARDSMDEPALFLVSSATPGVSITTVATTDRQLSGHLDLAAAEGQRVGGRDAVNWLVQAMTLGLCAIQCGVARAATELTAGYISERRQFGKPLAQFQGVLMRIADAHIATEAMATTTYAAAEVLAQSGNCPEAVSIAKWWASQAGVAVVETALHLHGGAGNVLDYALPRFYLWAKQNAISLGGPAYQLQILGELLEHRAGEQSQP